MHLPVPLSCINHISFLIFQADDEPGHLGIFRQKPISAMLELTPLKLPLLDPPPPPLPVIFPLPGPDSIASSASISWSKSSPLSFLLLNSKNCACCWGRWKKNQIPCHCKRGEGLTLRRYSLLAPNLLLPSSKCTCNNVASAFVFSKRANTAGEVKLSAVVINSTIAWECDWGWATDGVKVAETSPDCIY